MTKAYSHKEGDQFGFNPEFSVGFAEIQGVRDSQEDKFLFGPLPEPEKFLLLTKEQIEEVLKNTVSQLNEEFGKERQYGSTFLLCIILNGRIITVNVGDSRALLFNSDGSLLRLNKILHNPVPNDPENYGDEYNNAEKDLVKNFKGIWRVNGLAVSRTLGNKDWKGIKSHPDVYFNEYSKDSVLLLACDGLTETNCLSEKDIATCIQQNTSLLKNPLPLVEEAYLKGSTDNITVLITKLNLKRLSRFLLLCDGHGSLKTGHILPEKICENFTKILKAKINSLLEVKPCDSDGTVELSYTDKDESSNVLPSTEPFSASSQTGIKMSPPALLISPDSNLAFKRSNTVSAQSPSFFPPEKPPEKSPKESKKRSLSDPDCSHAKLQRTPSFRISVA